MDDQTKKIEIKKTLKTTMTLEDVRFFQYLKSVNSPFVSNIEKLYEEKGPILAHQIPKVFGSYTLHDISHSIRVLEHCCDLVGDLSKLSQLDITIIVYAAILHDIGMVVSDRELEEITCSGYEYDGLKYSSMLELRDGDEKLAMQDFIRKIHACRSCDHVMNDSEHHYLLPGQSFVNFKNEVANVCKAHNMHHSWIVDSMSKDSIKGDYSYNLQFCSLLLRLGDLLDFDSNRTPPSLYKMIELSGFGDEEWKQHFMIQNSRKVVSDGEQKAIAIIGESKEPKIHRKFLEYMNWIEEELKSTLAVTRSMGIAYQLKISPNLDNRIETKGYTFSDKKLTVNYHAIINLLMGESIYGDRQLALRELIQNSIDACKICLEFNNKKSQYGDEPYRPMIKVILDQKKNTVCIKDNGIGMDSEIVANYFLNIGKSYYTSEAFVLQDYKYKPIGNFGIGFLAGFMVSDDVNVKTRHMYSDTCISIDLEKNSEYIILSQEKDLSHEGTVVTLNYDSFMSCFENEIKQLEKFLKEYFLTDDLSVELVDVTQEETWKIENLLQLNCDTEKKNEYILPLSDYLHEVDGEIKIKCSDEFLLSCEDLRSPSDDTYCFDGTDLVRIEDLHDISALYGVDSIGRMDIPIIESCYEDTFEKYYEVLGDYDEAIDKILEEVECISIFFKPPVKHPFKAKIIEAGDCLIGDIEFEKLAEYGHNVNCPTKVYEAEIKMHKNNNHYLRFSKLYHDRRWMSRNSDNWGMYVRNILIGDYNFSPTIVARLLDIIELKINILNSSIVPSVSRNDFSNEITSVLNYAINKAMHYSALDHLRLNEMQKNTLESFIKKYFSKNTFMEKIRR